MTHERLPGERDSEYAMRLVELEDRPWRVVQSQAKFWVVDARDETHARSFGPYTYRGNARNKARALNADHQAKKETQR